MCGLCNSYALSMHTAHCTLCIVKTAFSSAQSCSEKNENDCREVQFEASTKMYGLTIALLLLSANDC